MEDRGGGMIGRENVTRVLPSCSGLEETCDDGEGALAVGENF